MVILGLHRDNGSEDINARVAALLAKLHAEFTQSRSRRTNDNALAESKNGSVIRKHLGYSHIPGRFAQQVNDFAPGVLSPYLNCHRPCCFPTEAIDAKGRLRKRYPYATMTTPYEKLKSLPEATQYLKPGVTFEDLDAIAYAISDHEAARRLNEARATRCRSNQPSLTTRGLIRALTPLQAHFWIGKDCLGRSVIQRWGGAHAKEEAVHLFFQVFSGLGVHGAQAVFVDEHGLVAEPVLPGLPGDILEDPLAEFAGIGGTVEAFGLAAELDAIYHSSHEESILCD